jgi:Neuraminidase (sialidase)
MAGTSASILETDNGNLLFPYYIRKPDKKQYHSYVLHSMDKGRSWKKKVLIAADPQDKMYFCEPAVVQSANGDILALMRTNHPEDYLYQSRSIDGGMTWSKPEQTQMIGHPADFQLLPDGKLLAVYGYRHKPHGVRACISKDDGVTWSVENEIIITERGAHYDLGYPSVCLTDDDHLCVVYYANQAGTKDRWIECKRIPLKMLSH